MWAEDLFSFRPQVVGAHSIELGVWGPHDRIDLAHGADVLIHASFLNSLLLDCKYSYAYLVSKVLKEWHSILDSMEVGWDF